MPQLSEFNAADFAQPYEPDVELSIQRLVPVLQRFTAEEIDSMRMRLEALLSRRPPARSTPARTDA
ncbi:MAG: hypothetical protein JXO22_05505 [Phycisphaerae bacterium]|nr:hypothetical protein [Phycisphaerae bacterium]